jgi:hypothetical protein
MKELYVLGIFLLTMGFCLGFFSDKTFAGNDPSAQNFAQSMNFLYSKAIGTFTQKNGKLLFIPVALDTQKHPSPVLTPEPTVTSTPVPIPTPTRGRLTQNDITYVGAFRLPKETNGASRFGYGGGALALNPQGDPNGPNDGYPGSLYIVGHENDQMVAEVNIPVPKDQRNKALSTLNTAAFLQAFGDVTGGFGRTFDAGNGYRVDGLAYLDAQGAQRSPKIYWTARTYYNVDTSDDLSHGMSETNIANPQAKGMWRLGDYTGMITGGYIFPVPKYFADAYLGRKRLISGLFTQQGVSATSQGPALFAYAPWLDDQSNRGLPNGTKLSATELLYYPYTTIFNRGGDPIGNFPDHQVPDHWEAATWVNTLSKHAVIVVGRRSMADTYYGDARPDDCDIYKGYHGEPYEPRILFYDPAELALAADGKKDPTTIVPYLEWDPSQFFTPTCSWDLTGAAYDEAHKNLYIMHSFADSEGGEPTPLLYVFNVK